MDTSKMRSSRQDGQIERPYMKREGIMPVEQELSLRNCSWELRFYLAVYITYMVYGVYTVFRVRDSILRLAQNDEFVEGWTLLDRPRDNSNYEADIFRECIVKLWPWYALHLASSIAVYHWLPRHPSGVHAALSFVALLATQHTSLVVVMAALLASYYILSVTCASKTATWLLTGLWIVAINYIKSSPLWNSMLGFTDSYVLLLMMSWSMLRCSSFIFCRISDAAAGANVNLLRQQYSLEHYLGYTLYWPCLIFGPFLSYRRYIVLRAQRTPALQPRCVTLCWKLLRVAFWWLVMQFALHFLYIHYMAHNVKAVKLVTPALGRYVVAYLMGQFFYVYYIVTYGLGIAFARFDCLQPPPQPRCIGRIHYYSDVWKHFDVGLYEFLFTYIYIEICGGSKNMWRRLCAAAVTFGFVYIWHGLYSFVLLWSVLNFICVVAEKCFKMLLATDAYKRWTRRRLGVKGEQRLRALLGTQLFILAAFSNIYFISGANAGNIFMRCTYMNGIGNYIALTLCSYCLFQCSEAAVRMLGRSEKLQPAAAATSAQTPSNKCDQLGDTC